MGKHAKTPTTPRFVRRLVGGVVAVAAMFAAPLAAQAAPGDTASMRNIEELCSQPGFEEPAINVAIEAPESNVDVVYTRFIVRQDGFDPNDDHVLSAHPGELTDR
jgi:hypothetical protein